MYEKKNDWVVVFVVLIVAIFCGWLYADHHRNEPIYNNTDSSMERLEKRLDDIGQRVDSLQKRNEQNKETVIRVTETVGRSRENAVTVTDGIGEAERRLDNAIQASGRIKNRIADIESKYR